MAAITTWFRLQGRSRDDDELHQLAQRARDPLWLLARQWQLGEFRGVDGGSPIVAQMQRESARFERFCPGNVALDAGHAVPYDVMTEPLDARVAAEPVLARWTVGLDLESGAQLLRTLDAHRLSQLRPVSLAAWPVPQAKRDAITGESSEVMDLLGDDAILLIAQCRTTPSGALAYAALNRVTDPVTGFPNLPSNVDRNLLRAALAEWLHWCKSIFMEPAAKSTGSWVGSRLEYAFAVSARFSTGEQTLAARAFEGTALDWHTFDSMPGSLGATGVPETATQTVLPSPVRFRGMPPTRIWEFEDARLDLGTVSAGPTDLARLLVLDFALIFGNDWFLAPLDVPVGSLTRLTSLTVTDTFGVRTIVRPVHDANPTQPWGMFQPGDLTGTLLMPPTTIQPLAGDVREDVLMFRDDGADAAWAVERVVELVSDRAATRDGTLPKTPALQSSSPRYSLATRVPANWIPLVRMPQGDSTRLVAGVVLPAEATDATRPLSRLVTEAVPLSLYDEEVARDGTRVTRRYRLARWLDGSTRLWLARERGPGFGQGASRLEYDVLLDP